VNIISPKKKYETLISVNPERVKEAILSSGIKQSAIAYEIGVSPEHFSRTYKTGQIYQSWIDVICNTCDINEDYLTGKTDTATPYAVTQGQSIDKRKALKDLAFSFLWNMDEASKIVDDLSEQEVYNIVECSVLFMQQHINPWNIIGNSFDNVSELTDRIKALEKQIAKLERKDG